MSLLEIAITLAAEAHRGEKDKAGPSYILQPSRVMFGVETEDEQTFTVT